MTELSNREMSPNNIEKVWDFENHERVAREIEALVDAYGGETYPVAMGISQRKIAADLPTRHTTGGEPILARVYVDRDVRNEYAPKQVTRMQKIVNAVLARSETEMVTEVAKPNRMGIDFYTGQMGYDDTGHHPMLHWSITYGEAGDRVVEGIGRALGSIERPAPDDM